MNNIILCGFMGAGKTAVGKALAKVMNYNFIDTDELIEKEQKITIKEIFEKNGEQYFRDLEHEVCKKIADMEKTIVSTGGGVMTYQRNCDAIKKGGKVIFLDASFYVICERIGEDDTRPLFKDKAKAENLYNERKEKYKAASDIVINGDMTVEKTVAEVLKLFQK